MKQVLICLCLLTAGLFSGCAKPDDVQERVEEIYGHVYGEYVKYYDDMYLMKTNFDSLYYTRELYDLHRKIGDLERQFGEVIVHDVDFWICAQDFSKDLASRVLRVKMDGNRKAYVTITIHNCGHDYEQVLTMAYERGNWYIDDMFDDTLKDHMKKLYKEYKKKK